MAGAEAIVRQRRRSRRRGSGPSAPAEAVERGPRRPRGAALGSGLVALAGGLLLLLLLLAPLPYGSNRPWAWSVLAVAVGVGLVSAGAARVLARGGEGRQGREGLPWVALPAALATMLAWAWAALQAVPATRLPLAVAPHPFWAEVDAGGIGAVPLAGLGAEPAWDALVRLVAYGAAFWMALLLLRDGGRARRALAVFVGVATLYAAYGLVNHFAGWETVLWEDGPKAYAGYVTATFVNRNSFATYANLAIVAALGLLIEPFMKARGLSDFRRIAAEVGEKLLEKRGPLLLALVVLVSAMLLSGSRGGFLSVAVALAVMMLLVLGVGRPRVGVMVLAVTGACLLGWVLVSVSGAGTLQRLDATDETIAGRTLIYQDTLAMIGARPALGHGYGSYEDGFRLYQERWTLPLRIDKAHNTYLEHAAELGIPATVLLYLGPVLLFAYCVRGVFVRRKDQVFPLVAASATVLVAVHSLVDFSLQIPAVAVTYAVLLGMGVAQSAPSATPRQAQPGASLRE